MTNGRRGGRWTALLAVTLAGALAATACSSGDGGSAAPEGGGAGGKLTANELPASCKGEPIKVTAILPLTGPLAVVGPAADQGYRSAMHAINGECKLGRPIEVAVCDDKGDVNTSIACGRKAKGDGSLALIGSVGAADDGATASGLPGIFLGGTSAFELTDPHAYSSSSGLMLAMAGITAAKAQGARSVLLVLPDVPALQFASTQVEKLAKLIGVKYDVIFFPTDTTDYAPIAAQISERKPDAIGGVPVNPVPFVNALAAEGITAKDTLLCYPAGVFTDDAIHELGSTLDGSCFVSQTLPPTATGNEGIDQFRADMKAAGFDPDASGVQFATVAAWSTVQRLNGALLAQGPGAVASLDSQALVDAVVAHPVVRPETAPYDFRENQVPEFPDLKPFRVFTREVAILRLRDGRYRALSDGFVDVTKPPDLG